MTGRVLLRRARIDDADGGIVHMFCEPLRFSKQVWVCVAALKDWDGNHNSPPHLYES
jgi:hypothetical protein